MLLIVGCGYLGSELARRTNAKKQPVIGVTHRVETSAAIARELAIPILAADVSNPDEVQALSARCTPEVIVLSVSTRGGTPDLYRTVYLDGVKNLLSHFSGATLLFLSSTSVYGQRDGEWVNEQSEASPASESSRVLVEAENCVLSAGGIVLRSAAIYGPGRSVLLKRFLAGEAIIENGGERYLNQIHRDDLVTALQVLARERQRYRGQIYNVSDNTPLTQLEAYRWLSEQLDRRLPPEGPANSQRKRGNSNKRVSNRKLRETGWAPRFPSFRDADPRTLL